MTVRKQADRIENLETSMKRMDEQFTFLKEMIQLQSKNIESLNSLLLGTIMNSEKKHINTQKFEKFEKFEKDDECENEEKEKDKKLDIKTEDTVKSKKYKHLILSRRVV